MIQTETSLWRVSARLERYSAEDLERAGVLGLEGDALRAECRPSGVFEAPGNLLLNGGIQLMEDLLTGAVSANQFSNANARLGVGDGGGSVPTPAATDTGLTATTNKYFKKVDATYPSRSAQTVTWQSTYGTAVALFHWREWILDNGGAAGDGTTVSGTAWNKRGVDLGDKTGTSVTWVLSVTGTIS